MATISIINAREILDSRGIPTVECRIWLDSGDSVVTSVPSGTSVGKYEAIELRDNDPQRMGGKGVLKVVNTINNVIGPQLIGQDPTNQAALDKWLIDLDGTANKAKLGANAILAVSQAILKAGAASHHLPIYRYLAEHLQTSPQPSMPNCVFGLINGGEHGADNLDIQEFQAVPASFHAFPEALSMAVTLYHQLEKVLITKGAIHSVGLVGGFAPNLYNNTDAFEILIETIKSTQYTFAQDVFFGVDMESSSFYEAGKYVLKDKSQPYSSSELLEYYKSLRTQYQAFYIEDPFHEDDIKSWQALTAEIGATTVIAGDNLLSTNLEKTKQAIDQKLCNCVIVKPNQIGTITETIEVVKLAKSAGWHTAIAHRSGETNDDLVADLAVGLSCDYVKFGPPNRGERVAKYNRLLQIYQQLQAQSAV